MKEAFYLAAKDLKIELRSKQMLSAMFLFSLLIVIAFRFAFSETFVSEGLSMAALASASLWICFSFAAIVGMASSFGKEKDETLEGLLLCPIERGSIFLGKVLSNLVLVFAVDLLSIVFFSLFFSYDYGGHAAEVTGIALLGTVSLVLVGTLVAAISVNARAREVLLPILLIPLIAFTVIIPCVSATWNAISGNIAESVRDVQSIAAFAVIFGVIGYLLIDYVLEG